MTDDRHHHACDPEGKFAALDGSGQHDGDGADVGAVQGSLLRFLADRVPPGEPLTAATDLLETGLLDSMLIMDVCAYVERTQQVKLDHGDIAPRNFRTVEALSALIAKRRSP